MKVLIKRISIIGGVVSAAVLLLVFIPAYFWAPVSPRWAPKALRNWAYDMRLALSRPAVTAASLFRSLKGELGICLPVEGTPIRYLSGQLNISAALQGIDSDANTKQPAVLIVHGSTPQGKYLGLYRLLMQKLAEKGYVVMTIDLRGFGQSDDPPDLTDTKSFNFVEDVTNAYFYLKKMPEIDCERIFLLGHSFGGDVALSTLARRKNTFNKIALLGPGRRFIERGGGPGAAEFEYFRRREMRYMRLSDTIPTDVYIRYRSTLTIENHVGYLSEKTHAPIFLIDCEYEDREDHEFLKKIYQAISGEKIYYTLAGADHYINVANIGPIVFYDAKTLNLLVNELNHFYAAPQSG